MKIVCYCALSCYLHHHTTAQHTTDSYCSHSFTRNFFLQKSHSYFYLNFVLNRYGYMCVCVYIMYIHIHASIGIILFLIVHGDGCIYGVCAFFVYGVHQHSLQTHTHANILVYMCIFCNIREM